MVLTDTMDTEEIKDLLVDLDSKFFLVPSSNPRNTYRVLWYTLSAARRPRTCKVDILVPGPGALNIPDIPVQRIVYTHVPNIPVMPLLAMLLLKLQGWTDHRDSTRRDMREKQYVDVEDIDQMLEIAVESYGVRLREERWLPSWFIRRGRNRVKEYVEEFPESAEYWNQIGFRVS